MKMVIPLIQLYFEEVVSTSYNFNYD